MVQNRQALRGNFTLQTGDLKMLISKTKSLEFPRKEFQLSDDVYELLLCAGNCHPNDEIWLFWSEAEIQQETLFTENEKKFCIRAFQDKKYSGPMVWHRGCGADSYCTHNPVHHCKKKDYGPEMRH